MPEENTIYVYVFILFIYLNDNVVRVVQLTSINLKRITTTTEYYNYMHRLLHKWTEH